MLLVHGRNLQMIRRPFWVIDGTSRQKSPTQVGTLAAVAFDDAFVDACCKLEPFGDDPQIGQNALHPGRDADDVDVVFLEAHFFADQKLNVDMVRLLQ
ncbi:hypothetical protein D3C81_2155830 [compost metagenome]